MYIIGFDIGGTKIEGSLFCFGNNEQNIETHSSFEIQGKKDSIVSGFLCAKKRILSERHLGYEQILDKIVKLIDDLCNESKLSKQLLSAIGLSVPGPVDQAHQLIRASNSMIFANRDLVQDIKQKTQLSIPFLIENDANCFAYAEAYCGAGLEFFKNKGVPVAQQVSLGLILGSGFGGGVIIQGRIF
ncbi:MAG: ROK family protein, partial [Silvanigrellaceae bacterium]|nr:ROK family protein [Silvanigrellaceae bacterium]